MSGYHLEFAPLEDGSSLPAASLSTIANVFACVRNFYPHATAKRCPDGGYMFFRDHLDLLLFEHLKTDDDGSEGGLTIAESSARKVALEK